MKFAIQFATADRYGIFSDELYNLACARHLAAGYVEQPPLIALSKSRRTEYTSTAFALGKRGQHIGSHCPAWPMLMIG